MKISRRTFVKGAAVTAGGLMASQYLGGFELLVPRNTQAQQELTEELVPTTCWIGKQDCGVLARRINGRVVKLEGHPDHPRNRGRLCPKGQAQIMAIYDYNRVKAPLVRTNEKGVPGTWRQASWDEALTLVATKLNEVRSINPKLILWQKGRSKGEAIYDDAFVKTVGATKVGHGSYCSDAGYRAAEYTIGPHGVLHPDFRYTKYLLCWGWNVTNSGGNKLCWLTWNQQFLDARERGMKVVVIDPSLRGAGPFADDWLPIKPATDMALALALCNVLVSEGYVDQEYLKKYTNAPFLVKEDGYFLKVEGKEQVWDPTAGAAKPFDAAGVDPALEGEYTVNGVTVKTAFQLFTEHLSQYTPGWAAEVCGIPAEKIEQVARELGENAMIGNTIIVGGVELPYRPVSISAYHMSQQELGMQAVRAMIMVMMLLGAVEAVGGLRIDYTWKVHANYADLESATVKDTYDYTLKGSKFFPINSVNPGMIAKVMLNPQKYGVSDIPQMAIIHMANPAVSFTDQPTFLEAYKQFQFVAAIDPWLSKTADLFADVVLPAATMEKYEGPYGVTDQYTDASALRLPVMEPLYQSWGELDIYLDLCEKAGLLYGTGGYLDKLNFYLSLTDSYKLDLNIKTTPREIFDRWAKSQGLTDGISYFETNGVWVKGAVSPTKYYGYAKTPPFEGKRHRLYGEGLLRLQDEMKTNGAEEIYWQDYTPFPTWRPPTMWSSPSQYDLTLISYKKIEFKQSRSSQIPLLAELAPQQRLAMNPAAASARNIQDGDEVWVESHHAVTGETRQVKVKVALTEGMRPDVVGLPHHYGEVARHPWAEGQGPTPNTLFFTGEGYVTNSADNSFQVKVRVYKA